MELYTTTITIGFLWFSQMRASLNEYQNESKSFTWREGKGWLEKSFYCRGSIDSINAVAKQMSGWCTTPKLYKE